MPTPEEIAWASGLFEGEGAIVFTHKNCVSLRLNMTDHDCVRRFAAIVEHEQFYFRKRYEPHHKQQLCWVCDKKAPVERILMLLLPWLGERRNARAKEALERLDGNLGARSERTHCPRGHVLAGDNLLSDRGARQCRECKNRGQRRRYHEAQKETLI